MAAPAPHRRPLHAPTTASRLGSHVVATDGRRIPGETLDRLERLDDTVFAALAGDPGALDEAADAWRDAATAVDPRLLGESRQHYLRQARSRWQRARRRPDTNLTTGFAALEILGLLGD